MERQFSPRIRHILLLIVTTQHRTAVTLDTAFLIYKITQLKAVGKICLDNKIKQWTNYRCLCTYRIVRN